VREKVGVSARSSKAAALRDRCKQALGHHFASVYAYLRRVRSQEAASIDEAGVQRALHELVGQDKALLQGCFLTDQLVFQEMMLTDMSGVVDLAEHSMLEPLNGYIALDPELNWTDVNSFFRSPGAAYAGHTVALPLIAKVWCHVED
ncbi:protein kinase domain-containing protein, partial [Haematococcus lacustris]